MLRWSINATCRLTYSKVSIQATIIVFGSREGPKNGYMKPQDKKNKIDANRSAVFRNGFKEKKQKHKQMSPTLTLAVVLVSQPALTTSTYVAVWPQGD